MPRPRGKPLDDALPRHYEAGLERTFSATTSNTKSASGGMADAPDLGSGDASRESSSLSSRTNELENKLESDVDEAQKEGDDVALFSKARCTFPANPANPRSALVSELGARLASLVAAGDLAAARVISETIARLLGTDSDGQTAVIDLSDERVRKRQKR